MNLYIFKGNIEGMAIKYIQEKKDKLKQMIIVILQPVFVMELFQKHIKDYQLVKQLIWDHPSSNSIVWRSMQGIPYGVGTGQQVSKQLERRNSWPMRKRR